MAERSTFAEMTFLAVVMFAALGGFYVYWYNEHHPFRTHGHRRPRCASNLKQIAYALHLYSADHDEAFPESLPVLYEEDYLVDHKVFICPRARDEVVPFTPADPFTEDNVSYCYASGVHATDPPDHVVAFEEEWNHDQDGVNVLFVFGNVDWRTDLTWLHDQLEKQKRAMTAQGRTMRVLRPGWSDPPPDGLSWR